MKARYAVVLLVVGMTLSFLGGIFKIQHWPGASALLVFGFPIEAIGFLLLLIKVLRYPGAKDFLDS